MATRRNTGVSMWLKVHLCVVYAFLFVPIVLLAVLSFNAAQAIGLPMRGLTLDWYWTAISNTRVLTAFINSVEVGAAVAVLSTALGTLAALALRNGLVMRSWFVQLALLPLVTPSIVLGIALFMGFSFLGLPRGLFGSVLVGHVTFTIPYVFLIVSARLSGMDTSLEQAAADLGANQVQAFFKVTFPLLQPAIVGGGLLVFLLSFDEFIRTFFLAGLDQTLPLAIWNLMFDALTPEIAALMTTLLVFNVFLLLTGQWLLRRTAGS